MNMLRRCAHILFVTLTLTLVLGGCRADETTKQGIEGELCNDRDIDCRDGHVCSLGVCVQIDGGAYSCADVCDKLRSCQASSDRDACIAQCRIQFEGTCDTLPCPWSETAVDIYSACIVEDLTCTDLEDVPAARDTCFATLPYPEDREAVCNEFASAAQACSTEANTPLLEIRCSRLARTTTDESWSRTDACTTRIADGFCAEIESCFNEVFDINLDLGEGTVDGASNNVSDPLPRG
jgi:hypothetical protein